MDVLSSISGVGKLDQVFKRLPKTTQDKAGIKALMAGGGVIKRAASNNVKSITSGSKVATGTLAKGLCVYRMKKKRGMLRAGVMVRKGLENKKKIVNGKPVRVGLYASVLEYGKRNQPPRSWLRKAAVDTRSETYAVVNAELAKNMFSAVEAAK